MVVWRTCMCTRSRLQQPARSICAYENREGKRVLKIKLSSYTCEIKNRQLADKKKHLYLDESSRGQSRDVGMQGMHLHLRACTVSVLSMRVEHAGGSLCHCRHPRFNGTSSTGRSMIQWNLTSNRSQGWDLDPALAKLWCLDCLAFTRNNYWRWNPTRSDTCNEAEQHRQYNNLDKRFEWGWR